jgi:5'-phosphate synthase pdxT subunit
MALEASRRDSSPLQFPGLYRRPGQRRPTHLSTKINSDASRPTTNDRRRTTAFMKIGVLALQGDFDAHRKRLQELGAEVVLVKKPEQLDEIDGLVIPGGESSTFLKLLAEAGFEKLREFVRLKPTFGTCAGAILLAKEVENPSQTGLGAIDIGIRRNAYGRQIDSSIREGLFRGSPIEMVFIRAPKIERLGPGVEVLATEGNDSVVVRQGRTMAATFHPELTDDPRVHKSFLDLVVADKNA